ncbi:hypothetical protein IWX90DRAFT_289425 [Phyllosticta citrichinensis]|uniref:RRM domain-containing protein n=1 Tax=Phyllosticta citrichinensis TaxID=1130410 RepID=A0ABR1XPY5_9PEZI
MAALSDIESQRKRNFAGHHPANFGGRTAMYGTYQGQTHRPAFLNPGHPGVLPYHGLVGDAGLAALTQGFAGMNLHHPSLGSTKPGSHVSATSSELGVSVPAHMQHGQHAMVYQQAAQMIPGITNYHHGLPHSPSMQTPLNHYLPPNAFQYGHHMLDNNSPVANNWNSRVSSAEPALITPRRDSISSTEQDLPGTPYTSAHATYQPNVYMNGSPNAIYPGSGTPSPSHLGPFYVPQVNKAPVAQTIPPEIQELLVKEPAIPRAIPAPSSPVKPLDRSLENKNGETNVYIRGLLPETTDDMLHQWGIRFGDIQSSKSIIDVKTNLCKGFGFIKYYNFKDAENCIRGFHYLGYEVSFARESFYAKLKKFADEHNTNLYVSNIPRHINEAELQNIFGPFKVCSSKILRDPAGHGRGVGFARFETRDICEEVIKKFNNTPVTVSDGEEEHTIQIRYADTQEQKILKQQTAAARQFRAAEFEYGVLQSRAVSNMNPGLVAPQQRISSLTPQKDGNEFENYLNKTTHTSFGQGRDRNGRGFVARSSQLAPTQSKMPVVRVQNEDDKPRPTTPVIAHGDHSSTSSNAASDRE